jgi:hypothetical protein
MLTQKAGDTSDQSAPDECIGEWVLKKSVSLSGIAGLNRAF